MRQPRRVPWFSRAELVELHDLLFGPSASDETRAAGMSRMSIYISSPSCPAFVHLLHGLIGALALPYPPRSAQEAQVARMTYAMAVVRFVNGMVDPLQTGGFARPISHLAAQLGLPASLVALRHRATHEDLPPLGLLRASLEQAVDYVLNASFIPLLSSSSGGWERRARTEALVGRWKKVVKARVRTRDVENENASGLALRRLKKEMEGEDPEELVEAVVRVGLVPVGRAKRSSRKATAPTTESLAVWSPLLESLTGNNPAIPTVTAHAIAAVLVDSAPRFQEDAESDERELASYRWTLGTWLAHLWRDGPLRLPDEERAGVLRLLARELLHGDKVLRRVYSLLSPEDLTEFDTLLGGDAVGSDDEEEADAELDGLEIDEPDVIDPEEALTRMQDNLRSLEGKLSAASPATTVPARDTPGEIDQVAGWSRAERWAPCPIGVWV